MKFRDPKTGEVFEDIKDAYSKFRCGHDCDTGCPLYTFKVCNNWSFNHPAEAARLMDYEIIEEEPMEKTDKPRICEVLGANCENCAFESRHAGEEPCVRCSEAYSSQFKSKPHFTEEEVADMAAIRRLFRVTEVGRRKDGTLYAGHYNEDCAHSTNDSPVFYLPKELLLSLRPGQSVALEDIIRADR